MALAVMALDPSSSANAQRFVVSVEHRDEPGSSSSARAVLTGETGSSSLTELQANASQATLSPDGQRVAYVETEVVFPPFPPILHARLVVEPAAGGVRQVVREVEMPMGAAGLNLHKPAFSPSGRKIALGCEVSFNSRRRQSITPTRAVSDDPNCLGNVEEVDAAGGGATLLTNEPRVQSVRYIDDGEGILYGQGSGTGAGTFLHEMDHNGDEAHPLPPIAGVANAENPIASPEGTKIAFEGRAPSEDTWKVYVYDLGEQEARPLSPREGRSPTWTPDGAAVAYVDDSGAHQVNVDSGAQTTLLSGPVQAGGQTYNEITSIAFPQPRTFDNLAQRFRPNLYFDTSGRFRPLNVPSFFRERDPTSSPLHRGCTSGGCAGLVEANSLRLFPGSDDRLDIGQIDGQYRPPDSGCAGDERVDCNEGPAASAYYNTTENSPDGYSYADYWYFYRFNDYPGAVAGEDGGDHEGDWESVTLAFADGLQSTTFDYAQFSQHGHWSRYLRGTLECDGQDNDSCGDEDSPAGQRVSVYVANGSHANYPEGCGISPSEVPLCPRVQADGDVLEFGEAGYDGEREWGENGRGRLTSLIRFPPAAGWDGVGPKNWTDWPGRWGRQDEGAELTDGPQSPALQSHYSNPGDSVCVREEPDNECDDTPNRAARTTTPPSPVVNDARCQPWFGGMVVAAICNGEQVADAQRQRRLSTPGKASLQISGPSIVAKQLRSDSAPGIAQVVGRPLRVGDRVRLSGKQSRGAHTYVRVRNAEKLHGLRFDDLPENTQLTVALDAKTTPILRSSTGRVVSAERVMSRTIR